MKIGSYLDVEKLDKYVTEGYVNKSFHNTLPLVIFTYSRKAVHENLWDDVTRKCRGLIVDVMTGEVVARPFEKFFNLNTSFAPETLLENLPKNQPEVVEKLDGSLIIRFVYKGEEHFASKGSFHSEHAEWAAKVYKLTSYKYMAEHYGHKFIWPEGHTVLFELISPNNQIVVEYPETELRLIGIIDIESGREVPAIALRKWALVNGFKAAKYDEHMTFLDVIADIGENRKNEEGYVLVWRNTDGPPLRVKVKFEEYCRLHRLVTGVSPKYIWELMSTGNREELNYMLTKGTPAFTEFVEYWIKRLVSIADCHTRKCGNIYNTALFNGCATRKEYALEFNKPENKKFAGILFAMLDQDEKRAKEGIWKLTKEATKCEKPMRGTDGE